MRFFSFAYRQSTRAVWGVMLTAVIGLGAFTASATTAQAGLVSGCAGPLWGMLTQEVCIQVNMGAKRPANRTQYVHSIKVYDPNQVRGRIDAWGDGFYYLQPGPVAHWSWTINRWVRSGTNICGRIADRHGGSKTACIAIRV